MRIIDLSGHWQCTIEGQSAPIAIPGTLDQSRIGTECRPCFCFYGEAELCGKADAADASSNETDNSSKTRKFICKICGYVYEGSELPEDYICPLCKRGAEVFNEIN